MTTVFLSYAHDDKSYVSKLAESLRKEGMEVCLDTGSTKAGENWASSLESQILKSDAIITVISPQGKDESIRPNVYFEAGMAVAMGKPVSFIVPEGEIKSGRLPFALNTNKLFLRRTPAATAREVAQSGPAGTTDLAHTLVPGSKKQRRRKV